MKKSIRNILSVLFLVSSFQISAEASRHDPEVVKDVDLNRYAGFWFEVAHAPTFFQRDCVRSTAEYKVMSPTAISVHNVCYRDDDSIRDIEGVAKVEDNNEPAKLSVKFNFLQRGDYWIVDLDKDYQWAVVSGPRKSSLFILARQVPMNSVVLENLLHRLKDRGFDVEELIFDELP